MSSSSSTRTFLALLFRSASACSVSHSRWRARWVARLQHHRTHDLELDCQCVQVIAYYVARIAVTNLSQRIAAGDPPPRPDLAGTGLGTAGLLSAASMPGEADMKRSSQVASAVDGPSPASAPRAMPSPSRRRTARRRAARPQRRLPQRQAHAPPEPCPPQRSVVVKLRRTVSWTRTNSSANAACGRGRLPRNATSTASSTSVPLKPLVDQHNHVRAAPRPTRRAARRPPRRAAASARPPARIHRAADAARRACEERANWRDVAAKTGFDFHTVDNVPYWVESAYYACHARAAIERDIEGPPADSRAMCRELVAKAIDATRIMNMPEDFRGRSGNWIAPQLQERSAQPLAAFDLRYDGKARPSCWSSTPTRRPRRSRPACFNGKWLEDAIARKVLPETADQFNSLHERLIEGWKVIGKGRPSISPGVRETAEDAGTLAYIEDCARQAAVRPSRSR